MGDHVLKSEVGVEEFVSEIAEKVRSAMKAGRFQPVAFIMSAQFPMNPAIIQMAPWLMATSDVAVNVLRTAVSKYDAFGVLIVVEGTRVHEDLGNEGEPVVLFQLDHQYIGGRAWHAKVDGAEMYELERDTLRGGSFCDLIPAAIKAN